MLENLPFIISYFLSKTIYSENFSTALIIREANDSESDESYVYVYPHSREALGILFISA